MFIPAATLVMTTGTRTDTPYQPSPTRHFTTRYSKVIYSDAAECKNGSTRSAARNGPKPTIGDGARSRAYEGHGHHENAHGRNKNVTSGCRRTKLTRLDVVRDSFHTCKGRPGGAGLACGLCPGRSPRTGSRAY